MRLSRTMKTQVRNSNLRYNSPYRRLSPKIHGLLSEVPRPLPRNSLKAAKYFSLVNTHMVLLPV